MLITTYITGKLISKHKFSYDFAVTFLVISTLMEFVYPPNNAAVYLYVTCLGNCPLRAISSVVGVWKTHSFALKSALNMNQVLFRFVLLWFYHFYHKQIFQRYWPIHIPLQRRHNEHNGVSNHQPHDCLLKRLFRRRSKETSKLRVTGLCAGNSLVTSEFPAKWARNAENISIWWRHYALGLIVSPALRIDTTMNWSNDISDAIYTLTSQSILFPWLTMISMG